MSTNDRVAIVTGLRTPFAKAGTGLRKMRTVDLAITVVKELLARAEIAPREVTLCIYGQVVPTLDWLNIGREVVLGSKISAFSHMSGKDLVPPVPGFSREPTTGELMGEAAEKMAKENGITREDQDAIAHRSHVNAARAWSDGTYAPEVMHVIPRGGGDVVTEDNVVRKDSKLESYAKLPPVFDRHHGTITAGNSSPLTDGASALLVMRESKAKALGYQPLGYLKSWAYAAVDPGWQLLMAPVFAVPKALERAGLSLAQIDIVDIHEAFAAQLASNLKALASKKFAPEKMGSSEPVGEIDPAKLNVNGGSVAIGHPFAATGGRMVVSTLRELKKRKQQYGLLSICAAGGLGAVAVLEAT